MVIISVLKNGDVGTVKRNYAKVRIMGNVGFNTFRVSPIGIKRYDISATGLF